MKTKTMSALLRAVLLAAGLLLVVFFFLFLPFYGQDTVRYAPEFAWAYWPCLIWAWAFAVPIFWAMVPAWRVCGSIAVKGMAFTGKNARDLRTVSRLAFADAVIFPAGMLIVASLGVPAGGRRRRPAGGQRPDHLRGGTDMIVFNIDVMLARRKMSLTELSHRVGITMANLSILKTGKARAVRVETLNKLCRALDCQPGDLLEYRPGPENDNFEE